MNIAVRVQHHPSRADLLPELTERLLPLRPQVVTDPGGQRSTWRTHRLCLEAIGDATHVLVIQDDGWPCAYFAERLHAAVAEKPDRIVCLFVPGVGHLTRRVNQARHAGERWMEFPATSFVPCVATVYPREHALAIPEFVDARRMAVGRADDAVISTYVRAHRCGAVATLPSLVQHRDEVPSVMRMPHGNGHAHRLAAWYAG